MEVLVIGLHPMIGKRVSLQLSAGDPISIRERCQEERIHTRLLLGNVEHLLSALVQERNGTDLLAENCIGQNHMVSAQGKCKRKSFFARPTKRQPIAMPSGS
jgi:hypothetical protein